jgi:signal transduction histidine kinase
MEPARRTETPCRTVSITPARYVGRTQVPQAGGDTIPSQEYVALVDTAQLEAGPRLLSRTASRLSDVPVVVQDSVLALVLAAALLSDLARSDVAYSGVFRAPDARGYGLVALLVLPLALRRRYPFGVFMVILCDAVAVVALQYRPASYGFGLIVATYSVARWRETRISVVALALAQAFAIYAKVHAMAIVEVGWFEWPLDAVYVAAAWFLGHSIRSRQRYAVALERSREALAERAVEHERNRIARELHDSVGHAISVMLLHTGAAAQIVDRDPRRAADALTAAGGVGRAALAEMDHVLGLLRAHDHGTDVILRPSLTNLETLLDEFRALGLEITTAVERAPAPLPAALDRSAFRIIQEALTNTLKHAGPTRADVTVEFSPADVMVQVRDHGNGGQRDAPATGSGGRGIMGMRERTTMLDGHLTTGPCGDAGFLVSARLPLQSPGVS